MATPALDDTRPEAAADPGLSKQMLIGGQWYDALAGETLVAENPGRRGPARPRRAWRNRCGSAANGTTRWPAKPWWWRTRAGESRSAPCRAPAPPTWTGP